METPPNTPPGGTPGPEPGEGAAQPPASNPGATPPPLPRETIPGPPPAAVAESPPDLPTSAGPVAAAAASGGHRKLRNAALTTAELIALAAFIFSVANAFFAYCQISSEKRHQARIELNNVVRQLGVLQRAAVDLNQTCLQEAGNNAQQLAVCQATVLQYNAEQRALLDIGEDLMDDLEGNVASSEYRTFAIALSALNDNARAREFLDRARESAEDIQDRVTAQQLLANVAFLRSPGEARELYQQALDMLQDAEFELEVDRALAETTVLRSWLQNEVAYGDCDESVRIYFEFAESARKLPANVRHVFLGVAVADDPEDDPPADELERQCEADRERRQDLFPTPTTGD
jgi:hypothetical protein